jgi:DNA polymerase IIIc chi subunit
MKSCIFHDVGAGRLDRVIFEIADRAYGEQEKVLIFVQNEERASEIDRILWILKQEAFIPHRIFKKGEGRNCSTPVAIVTAEINPVDAGILVADGHCSMEFACGFDSIHEFVRRTSPHVQEACRERFRNYRSRQVPVEYLKK